MFDFQPAATSEIPSPWLPSVSAGWEGRLRESEVEKPSSFRNWKYERDPVSQP